MIIDFNPGSGGGGGGSVPSDVYTKAQIDAMVSDFITASTDDLINYYLKSETYTQSEVDNLLGAISGFSYDIVPSTASVTNPQSNVLYLVGPSGSGNDQYEEYIYTNSTWTKIGDTSIDLSDYVTSTELTTILNGYVTTTGLENTLSAYTPTGSLSNVATSGSYNDLSDTPVLSTVATSGNYNDLTNKPTIPVVPTLATVATTGDYDDLTNKPVIPVVPTLATVAETGSYNDLTDKPVIPVMPTLATVAETGSYSDLTGTPSIPVVNDATITVQQDGETVGSFTLNQSGDQTIFLTGGGGGIAQQQADWAEDETTDVTYIKNKPVLSTVATSGSYNDLTDKPVIPVVPELATVAETGSYNDLTDKPTIPVVPELATVATTGAYSDLTGTPTISTVGKTGNYSDLNGAPTLASVAVSGDYDDLTNKPVIPVVPELATVAETGSYNDLTDKPDIPTIPTLATVATTGAYSDLTGKPTIATCTSELTNDSGFITNTVNNLVNYYLKSETYTQSEVNNLIGAINQFTYEIVQSTSSVTNPQSNVLYLVGPTGSGSDKYSEYVYANSAWVKIGDTSLDLSGYVTTTDLQTALNDYITSTDLTTALAGYATTAQLSTVATSGSYNDLTDKPSIPVVPTLATVAETGSYNDLTDKPTIPVVPELATVATTGAYSDLTGKPVLSTVATTGNYNDLTNKPTIPVVPTLATVAETGSYNDLTDKPTIPTVPTLATVATTGNYNDLTNKLTAGTGIAISTSNVISATADNIVSLTQAQYNALQVKDPDTMYVISDATAVDMSDYVLATSISTVATTGSYNDLTDKPSIPVVPTLATVAETGSYNDLTDKPTIPVVPTLATVATTGDYNDLTNKPVIPVVPTLATVATSGSYNDLTDKPTIPVVPTLATVATSGDYNDLSNTIIAGDGLYLDDRSNTLSVDTSVYKPYVELLDLGQSDLEDIYTELTYNDRSAGPTTIENWLMGYNVAYYGYPIVSGFIGDYTVDNNGNLAPISPRSAGNTKAPVQVSDTKVVFGYYPDVRVSGKTVSMKYVILQSDGTLATAVDTITITSGGGGGDKEYVYMSTEDSTAEEWEQLYSDLYGDGQEFGWDNMQEWFHTHELFINDIEIMWDRTEYGYYIFDDNGQLKYDQNEEEQVIVLFGGLELWNNAEIEGTGISNIYYYAYILHEDGTVDLGGDTLNTKPVVDLYDCSTETREAIYNWMMDNTPEDYMTFHDLYYYGRPVTNVFTGFYTIDGGVLVENSDPDPEDVVVFKLDTYLDGIYGEEDRVATSYAVLYSDGTIDEAVNVIVFDKLPLTFTLDNGTTATYTFVISSTL